MSSNYIHCFHYRNQNIWIFKQSNFQSSEAVVQRCSVKKMLLEILKNLQENTCEFCEITMNTFSVNWWISDKEGESNYNVHCVKYGDFT